MNSILKSTLLTLALLLLSLFAGGQIPKTSAIHKIDSIISEYMMNNKMVGVSIGIVKDQKVYLTKGYGTTEINGTKPIDSLTNFLTCSITKLVTASAIMQLVEQGKIDISQKLIFYLPDFEMKDKRYKDITIEHMLTHTSGLFWDLEMKHSPKHRTTLKNMVYSLDNKKLNFAPGSKFNPTSTYSNTAYDILGYLVQKISGKPYQNYVTDHILLKANMPYSNTDYNSIPVNRRSSPHIVKGKVVKVGGIYAENVEHSPSGNLNSCSIDLCHWMIHTLNIYNNDSSFGGVLHKNTLQNMWTTRHVAPQNKNVSIGLGWWITQSEDLGTYYWHVGNNPGFSATLMVFPTHNFGITVLSNGMYAEQIVWNRIPFDIINVLKGELKN